MPRIARAVATGYPHHVVQRGNNRDQVFSSDSDRYAYIALLKKYSEKWRVKLLAYCLMSNHIHLLLRPQGEESLHKMMQGVTLCYTQHINRTHGRSGRLWESRYYSSIIDKERYLWAVARYIEQNPVRARMVNKAEDYPYSSALTHVRGELNGVVNEELFDASQRDAYRALLGEMVAEDEMTRIRYSIRTGRPMGSEEFIGKMERKLGRCFKVRPPGRPKKVLEK